jgi:F-type H+-transporting ATPase subunit b
VLLVAALAGGTVSGPSPLWAQPAPEDHAEHAEPGGEPTTHEEAAHEESIWGPISRFFNSAVLFGLLYYFLRAPVAAYLADRSARIRGDLLAAAKMKESASTQIAELERKMAALPGELEALKARGQEEIASEELRIEQAAAAERERLVEQTRREIDLQLRIAERELVEHASNLAVKLATERIQSTITPADQSRLVDRYLEQVKQ